MTAEYVPLTRTQVREALAHERGKLLVAVEGLSVEEMARPGAVGRWSVRDVLAHILAWEEEAVTRLDLLAAGRP
ncbi:MAG TPA: DinB family protein [Dehalococcoidia bacterium]|nr:DinB family protein [Dehalococcoidia bacterium]